MDNITTISGRISSAGKISGKLEKPETVYVAELNFGNRLEFPAIGNAKNLYIANDENAVYRFDESTLTYICVARNYEEIEAIESYLGGENE